MTYILKSQLLKTNTSAQDTESSSIRACTKIRVANDTVLDLTKPQFLSNSDNKQSFVDYLALKLANIPGIEYVKARDNADCLIIDTAILAAAEYLRCVTVVGDDTDLIVLLLHKTKDIELNTAQLRRDLTLLATCVRRKPFIRHILSFYLVSGCNTTSRIFMKGKQVFGIPEADTEYWRSVKLFEDSNVPKAVEVASVIAAETFPPTFHAADLNSFRTYLQVQRPGSNWLRFSSD